MHATDALRFCYCLLHQGKWGDKQLVPADYIAMCNKPLRYNPHCPFTLQFEQNIGFCVGCWLFGQLAWNLFGIVGSPTSPNAADFGWWAFAVLVMLSIVRMPP